MDWKVEVSASAAKDLKKIDKVNAAKILKFLRKVEGLENPRNSGKALKGVLKYFWRYRVGDYRIICEIQDDKLVVLTLKIGHRKKVYD